jgi:LacI family transcriptional regulator
MEPRRPTSADVAALAGVSRATVSFVLNDRPDMKIRPATRRRVIEAAARLGYHPHAPARQLAAGSSLTLGLVLRQSPDQVAGDALLAETLRGLATAARSAGYRVLVEPLEPGDGSYAGLARSAQADGLVISGPRSDDEELTSLLRDDFPLILQGSLHGLAVASVDVDNAAGATRAVEHLIGLGHRRIACITNAPLAYTAAADRLAGYREALERAAIDFDPDLVGIGGFDPASGSRAMDEILARSPHIDAVFVASDVVALGAIGTLRAMGFAVPGDVSVVGFDDIPLAAYFDPPLTTIRVPAHELGLAAGRALLDRISRVPVEQRTLLPTDLVVRSSTRPRQRESPDSGKEGSDSGDGKINEPRRPALAPVTERSGS